MFDRLIDRFRKVPELAREEREALIRYLAKTTEVLRTHHQSFFRLKSILHVASQSDERKTLASEWMADGMRYLADEAALLATTLTVLAPTAAVDVHACLVAYCESNKGICETGEASFRAMAGSASEEEFAEAFDAFTEAHKAWRRNNRRFDREWKRVHRRYGISAEEIEALVN